MTTDHRAEAVRLLTLAEGAYLDTSNDAAEREHYETEDEWLDAIAFELEQHEKAVAEAQMLALMATAHALLAQGPGESDTSGTYQPYRDPKDLSAYDSDF